MISASAAIATNFLRLKASARDQLRDQLHLRWVLDTSLIFRALKNRSTRVQPPRRRSQQGPQVVSDGFSRFSRFPSSILECILTLQPNLKTCLPRAPTLRSPVPSCDVAEEGDNCLWCSDLRAHAEGERGWRGEEAHQSSVDSGGAGLGQESRLAIWSCQRKFCN